MSNAVILIIDDEAQIRKLLEITLESNNFKVINAINGKDGIIAAANHPPDLILLDIGLPDISGHDVLTQLRQWYNGPIIMLSVLNDEENIVMALDNGADDYLTKPFRTGELLARVRRLLRNSSSENQQIITCKNLEIDLSLRLVKKNNNPVKLTSTEYNLLAILAKNEGKVLTHNYLLNLVWGPGYVQQSQYLRVFIAQLRKKIEDNPNNPEIIITESSVGYRLVSL
ncbi:MAG: response regulator transcription factor [Bacteroidota bacterium]|nr:response regulator transcription factor [Bacteroidota bacterium]